MSASIEDTDIVVVGAGPCGLAVGAAAAKRGVGCVLFDKGCITQSLIHYPTDMTFFSTAENLEIAGVPFSIPGLKPSRREALAYYRGVARHFGMDVRQYEKVTDIRPIEGLGAETAGRNARFDIQTRKKSGATARLRAQAVVVATGGFHEPNLLGVPGEELDWVRHYYREPYPYYDQNVLVIGGANSAVETALDLFWHGSRVTMVHFEDRFDRGVKPWVLPDIENRIAQGEIRMYWRHRIEAFTANEARIRCVDSGETREIANDWAFAMTGWRPNHAFLEALGIGIDPESGIPDHDPETMESSVPGLYIAGVIAAGNNANKIFIENGKVHGERILNALHGPMDRPPFESD